MSTLFDRLTGTIVDGVAPGVSDGERRQGHSGKPSLREP